MPGGGAAFAFHESEIRNVKPSSNRAWIVFAVASVAVLAAVGTIALYVPGQRGLSAAGSETESVESDVGLRPKLQVITGGHLSLVSRDHPDGPRTVTGLACDRAYAAAGTVACLRPVDALTRTELVVLDSQLTERQSLSLIGFPNRTTVSPSGRMIAWTLIVDEHSHVDGGPATSTGILDTRTGALIRSLDGFAVVTDGHPARTSDPNISSVSFADDNRFYASMSFAGRSYLVEGDIRARRLRTVASDVESPSLSPDGTRIAFTHVNSAAPDHGHGSHGGPEVRCRLSILDLKTLRITHVAETRSVDDQAVWLDGVTVAYSLQRPDGINDVWAVPADGTGTPRVLVVEANSPSTQP